LVKEFAKNPLHQNKSSSNGHKQGRWAGSGRQADKAGRMGEKMCPFKLPIFLRPLPAELTFTTRQVVRAIYQSI